MGYRKERTLYKLVFPDHDGLTVRARSVELGKFLAMTELAEKDDTASIRAMIECFAEALHDWNLETEEGEPVPATLEGVLGQELDFVLTIIDVWMDAIGGVDPALKAPLNGGPTSLVASLPMDVPSLSQAS